jgi:hypothetical protein
MIVPFSGTLKENAGSSWVEITGGVMAAHAGEKAQETGVFHCSECQEKVQVKKGQKISKCPNGHTTFESRTGEPRR